MITWFSFVYVITTGIFIQNKGYTLETSRSLSVLHNRKLISGKYSLLFRQFKWYNVLVNYPWVKSFTSQIIVHLISNTRLREGPCKNYTFPKKINYVSFVPSVAFVNGFQRVYFLAIIVAFHLQTVPLYSFAAAIFGNFKASVWITF